jgi:hypothetical protein
LLRPGVGFPTAVLALGGVGKPTLTSSHTIRPEAPGGEVASFFTTEITEVTEPDRKEEVAGFCPTQIPSLLISVFSVLSVVKKLTMIRGRGDGG